MADIEMKPAEDAPAKEEKKEEAEEKKEPPTPVEEIKANAALLEKAVASLEPRFTHRVLRTLTALRKKIDDSVLRTAINEIYTKGTGYR
jgi:26S proteasome regulatory subunit N3